MITPSTTQNRPTRRLAALALTGCATGVALVAPMTTQAAHAAPTPTAASTPATTYTAPASATWSYTAPGVAATVTVTRLADTAYKVNITGTTQSTAPTSIPVQFSSGVMVPTGTYPMASGHGVMNLTTSAATFTFTPAYEQNYTAPFTFSGEWTAVVTTAQTSTQTITVGGHPYTIAVQAPATSGQADGAGQRIMVTRSFEVDNATLRNATVAGIYFSADNDGGLSYGELAKLYTSNAYRHDFAEQYKFVTVKVAKNATSGEVFAAINQQLPKGWAAITTNARQSPGVKAPLTVTTAWEIQTGHGATPAPGGAAWGPRHNVPEIYIGSSTQHHI